MTCFKNPRFAEELAFRTKYNYYKLFARDPVKWKEKEKFFDQNLDEMKKRGYVIDEYFEVTQLINSLIGLLVIPQQEYFQAFRGVDNFDDFPILRQCLKAQGHVFSYYEYRQHNKQFVSEKRTPPNVLRHMRNAIAHNRIMLEPESADHSSITHIIFNDACYYKRDNNNDYNGPLEFYGQDWKRELERKTCDKENYKVCRFRITVEINFFEPLLLEIADYFINFKE